MSEFLPRHYIISIIVFTMVILGGMSIIGELRKTSPSIVDDTSYANFNNTFNKYDTVTSEVEGIQSNIEDSDAEPGLFGSLNSLISGAWNTLKLLGSSFGFMGDIFESVGAWFGLPAWVGASVSLLFIVLISFAIYSAIFQRDI